MILSKEFINNFNHYALNQCQKITKPILLQDIKIRKNLIQSINHLINKLTFFHSNIEEKFINLKNSNCK